MNQPTIRFSVIIPLGPADELEPRLVRQLIALDGLVELIISATRQPSALSQSALQLVPASMVVCWLSGEPGRARQQNLGAHQATAEWLWFVHADSELHRISGNNLFQRRSLDPACIYFFELRFAPGGPWQMPVNEFGVWLRSNLLKMPFGDQGLWMHRRIFDQLGGFDTTLKYGEDHALIWRARLAGYKVRSIGEIMVTSSRKYAAGGWMNTTWRHLVMTYRQAFAECRKFWRSNDAN